MYSRLGAWRYCSPLERFRLDRTDDAGYLPAVLRRVGTPSPPCHGPGALSPPYHAPSTFGPAGSFIRPPGIRSRHKEGEQQKHLCFRKAMPVAVSLFLCTVPAILRFADFSPPQSGQFALFVVNTTQACDFCVSAREQIVSLDALFEKIFPDHFPFGHSAWEDGPFFNQRMQ